jgi:hypothetical protein
MVKLITGVTDLEVRRPAPHELSKAEKRYLKTLTAEEAARHLNVRRYPSGQYSRGGANRSAKIARERHQRTLRVTPCPQCGGVDQATLELTSLYPRCTCNA